MKASLRGSITSRSQPSSTPDSATAHSAMPARWLSDMVRAAGLFATKDFGSAGRRRAYLYSVRGRGDQQADSGKQPSARFAVQRPSRQSARRLAKRRRQAAHASFALSQSFSAGTSASVCSSQYTSIKSPLRFSGRFSELGLPDFRVLYPLCHPAFHRIDEVRAQVRGRNNVMQRAHVERPLHAVHAVKLRRPSRPASRSARP